MDAVSLTDGVKFAFSSLDMKLDRFRSLCVWLYSRMTPGAVVTRSGGLPAATRDWTTSRLSPEPV